MTELLAVAVIIVLMVSVILLVKDRNRKFRESLDDDIPGWDDWKSGSPDDPPPPDAKPLDGSGLHPQDNVLKFDPLAPSDDCCGGLRRTKRDEED